MQLQAKTTKNLDKFALGKMQAEVSKKSETATNSLEVWIESYLQLAVIGVLPLLVVDNSIFFSNRLTIPLDLVYPSFY